MYEVNAREKFNRLLTNICIDHKESLESQKRKREDFANEIKNILPEKLYRYRKCDENSLLAFSKDEVWFSPASSFNDLHDCLVYIDIQKLYSKFISECASGCEDDFLGDLQFIIDLTIQHIRKTKIACFSEDNTSPLMWAHYADYNKGFCIEYLIDKELFGCIPQNAKKTVIYHGVYESKNAHLYPVIYSSERYDATQCAEYLFNVYMQNQHFHKKMDYDLLYAVKSSVFKSIDWLYEKEWRMIYDDSSVHNKKDYFPINMTPNAVYFGTNISKPNKDLLTVYAKSKKISLYQMSVDYFNKHYKLNSAEIHSY